MSIVRLAIVSLIHHWRANLAVACGVAVATAVLTGALLVGDSMRASLRRLTLDRLGRIDEAMTANHFFREGLAGEIGKDAAPAILLQVGLENPDSGRRANRASLIGCDDRFWRLGGGRSPRSFGPHEIVLNQPAADRLGVRRGDAVLLRLPKLDAIPAESLFGRKRDAIRTERVVVSEVIPAAGLGTFSLRPTQRPPLDAFVSLDWLESRLDRAGEVNAILVAGEAGALRPRLADYGLRVERTRSGVWNITSDRMMLDPAVEREVLKSVGELPEGSRDIQPVLTYLANTLAVGDRDIPYSTIAAVDFARQPLGPNEIALNTWAADQLNARVGDTVRLSYFKPESLDGQAHQRTVDLRLAAIVPLAGATGDRTLTPSVKGMTDKLTMANWDPPFPFDAKRIRPVDEEYWTRYGATPKAFVSLATGRRLWASRFGQSTSLRIASKRGDLRQVVEQQLDPAAMGMAFQPIRRQQLAASDGNTPFGVLFLAFSFFIIAAAVMLVAILFRLGIDRRAAEIGTLLALGWSRRQIGRLLLGEGAIVAAAGALLGLPAAIGYAALMLAGLQTWWLAAIATPFLRLHVAAASLAVGFASGLVVAIVVIWVSTRRIARIAPRRLMAGVAEPEARLSRRAGSAGLRRRSGLRWIEVILLLTAVAPTGVLLSLHLSDEVRAGMFFGAGATALVALLGLVWLRLRAGMTGSAVAAGRGNLLRMALRNAARNPGRSTLTVGLVAAASFIIVSVSAFRLDPSGQTPSLGSGNGGFALVAESDQPIYQDVACPGGKTVALRVGAGDDASCLNLYRPSRPRVLGVPQRFIDRDGFAWADKPRGCVNPWQLLEANDESGAVPVILEKNTANYSLQLWGGLGETFEIVDGRNRRVRLRVVALLTDSIFQGDLLVSDAAFLRLFPDTSGRRLFLVDCPVGKTAAVQAALEQDFAEYGLSVETTGKRQAAFLAVQNTYLSTFQSLGGLGLLLGTLGLAAVQLRNVFERRGELALLRAVGFRRSALGRLVFLEHAALLGLGLAVGAVAASLAVMPHLVGRGATVPWASLAGTLLAVLVVGLAAGAVALRAAARAPLLAALREEPM